APLIGHHQLVVGLLRANLLSPDARIVISGAEPARGGVPLFSYTDVAFDRYQRSSGHRGQGCWVRQVDARDLDDGPPRGFLAGAIVEVRVALRLNWA
ncbi:MAG: hypothetical protein ACLPKH_15480, partial [Rhodomicrobium sp.]